MSRNAIKTGKRRLLMHDALTEADFDAFSLDEDEQYGYNVGEDMETGSLA